MSFKSPYRMFQGWRRPREAAMGFTPVQPYFERVLDTGPIAYWIQGEAAGLVAVDQINSPAQDGTYVGVTLGQPGIGDGNTSPFFDGVNDFNNIFTAAFAAAFNGGEGTVMLWARVFNVGVWTDAAFRHVITIRADGNNQLFLRRLNINNQLEWYYEAGNVIETVLLGGLTTIDWMNLALTWSASTLPTGEMRAYYNGAQTGATQVALGAWAGAPLAANTVIGSFNLVPLNPWHGWLAHGIVWDRPLTPAEVLSLGVL